MKTLRQNRELAVAMVKYSTLHASFFFSEESEDTSDSRIKLSNLLCKKTFKELLEENGLGALIPVFSLTTTIQGYGFIERLPAFYGLWWNSPELIAGFLSSELGVVDAPASLLEHGFQKFFEDMSSKFVDDITHIKKNYTITHIARSDKISITGTFDKVPDTQEFDFLILTANLREALGYLDAIDLEGEVFGALTEQANLVTTLFSCDTIQSKEPIFSCGASLDPIQQGHLMSIRSTRRILGKQALPGGKENWVGYQYMEKAQDITPEYKQKLRETLLADLEAAGITGVEVVGEQEVWPYFSRFNQDGLNKLYPLRILGMQGMKNTWYAGASTLFESVNDCMHYNLMLLSKYDQQAGARG